MKGGSNKKRRKREEEEEQKRRRRKAVRVEISGRRGRGRNSYTNDNNDEPNIDPVKPVRLPSLYSPRASPPLYILLSSIFTPSFHLSLSLSIFRESRSLDTDDSSLGTLLERSWNRRFL